MRLEVESLHLIAVAYWSVAGLDVEVGQFSRKLVHKGFQSPLYVVNFNWNATVVEILKCFHNSG